MGRSKYILIISVIALIVIGLSYAIAARGGFDNSRYVDANLIEFVPDECKVTDASEGVTATVEFKRDKSGNIADKTYISLNADGVYAGANTEFSITAQNISNIPLSVDDCKLKIDNNNKSLEDLTYFSCKVKLFKNKGQYYDLLGYFDNIGINELAQKLTSIMKYRKIDINEKLVLEFSQKFDKDQKNFVGKSGLSYKLIPVVIQYFPKNS